MPHLQLHRNSSLLNMEPPDVLRTNTTSTTASLNELIIPLLEAEFCLEHELTSIRKRINELKEERLKVFQREERLRILRKEKSQECIEEGGATIWRSKQYKERKAKQQNESEECEATERRFERECKKAEYGVTLVSTAPDQRVALYV